MNRTINDEKLLDAIRDVGEDLRSLPHEEFMKELERHKGGDFAGMLLETNALCVQGYNRGEEV